MHRTPTHRLSKGAAIASLLWFATAAVGYAQTADTCVVVLRGADFTGVAAELARIITLQDSTARESFLLRRVGREYHAAACLAPVAVQALAQRVGTPIRERRASLLPVDLLAVANSAYPRDWNDGALWAGRGVNASLTTGAELRWAVIRAAVAPVFTWQQNNGFRTRAFSNAGYSPLAHPFFGNSIDVPQRFGDQSFARVYPGQSFVRLEVRGFAAGLSSENLVWGPARRNPVMLSGTAPGFPHVFLETGRAVNIGIGSLEFQLFWGRLSESDYFDDNPDNDHRALAGVMVVLQPAIFDGLSIGGGRLHAQTWWRDKSLNDLLLDPYRALASNVTGLSASNQLLGLFFRFAAAPQGLEVYGDWARDDNWEKTVGLFRNLDASQGYTLGLQKVVRRGTNLLRVAAEITHLADALPINFASRGNLAFYTHSPITQGHTHRGQMLGAPIGTGGEAQYIGADYFWRAGRSTLSIERARYNAEAYNEYFAPAFGAHARDTELSLRAGHVASIGELSIDGELGWSLRYNRSFLGLNPLDTARPYRREDNVSLRVAARWNPDW